MNQQDLQLPDGFRPLETQVAGHTFQTDTIAIGLLQDATGCVLKCLGKPECGERELNFYESLLTKNDAVLAQLRLFVPKFYKKVNLRVHKREHTFIQLEDLTLNMRRPCIMDIKMGKRTWDPVATQEKRAVEEQKYARCKETLGICLPGFQLYRAFATDEVQRFGKDYGKKLDPSNFAATMRMFLNLELASYPPMLKEILAQLRAIQAWFSFQTLYHFYASSLLIIYDCESLEAHITNSKLHNGISKTSVADTQQQNLNGAAEHTLKEPKHWIKVRMIDFAHVFPAENETLDSNYLFGLNNLIMVLESLLQNE